MRQSFVGNRRRGKDGVKITWQHSRNLCKAKLRITSTLRRTLQATYKSSRGWLRRPTLSNPSLIGWRFRSTGNCLETQFECGQNLPSHFASRLVTFDRSFERDRRFMFDNTVAKDRGHFLYTIFVQFQFGGDLPMGLEVVVSVFGDFGGIQEEFYDENSHCQENSENGRCA